MSTIPKQKLKKNKKLFTSNPELKDLSKKCKSAWKNWRSAGCPSAGPEYEERKRLARLTKQCANKCHASANRKSWKKHEKMFRSKDASELHPIKSREFENKPALHEILGFIIVNSSQHSEFDEFKQQYTQCDYSFFTD